MYHDAYTAAGDIVYCAGDCFTRRIDEAGFDFDGEPVISAIVQPL